MGTPHEGMLLGVLEGRRLCCPLIFAVERGTRTDNHTVGVEHRHDEKQDASAQRPRLNTIPRQKAHDPTHHEGGVGFARVNTCRDSHHRARGDELRQVE
eukprot:scaffold121189_cov31-Tisochrysis_lutea.AAC.1